MRRLLLSVHDVSPVHWVSLRRIAEDLRELGVSRYSMLVVPDYHGKWPLEEHSDFCRWLAELEKEGAELVLHGLTHMGAPVAKFSTDGIRSMIFTRGEGEFLGLSRERALSLVEQGLMRMEETLGSRAVSFVAPAWLYSRGTLRALGDAGVELAESRWRIWSPSRGRTILRLPVANYAGGGSLKRTLASVWVGLYGCIYAGRRIQRFALHPSDFEHPDQRERVLGRLRALAGSRKTAALADLLPVS